MNAPIIKSNRAGNAKVISRASRAAVLAELSSNPRSFFNRPDLHGGVPGLPSRPLLHEILAEGKEDSQGSKASHIYDSVGVTASCKTETGAPGDNSASITLASIGTGSPASISLMWISTACERSSN